MSGPLGERAHDVVPDTYPESCDGRIGDKSAALHTAICLDAVVGEEMDGAGGVEVDARPAANVLEFDGIVRVKKECAEESRSVWGLPGASLRSHLGNERGSLRREGSRHNPTRPRV